ncbi:MAG: Trm112 family protein [Dehalococcoidia bacterium]|nr:Trm112 family protein [Dehalococcoidia bacterium]
MRRDLMEILACPVCKGELTLHIEAEEGDEIVAGFLHCAACDERYPIVEGIPNLLPPELRRALEAEQARRGS